MIAPTVAAAVTIIVSGALAKPTTSRTFDVTQLRAAADGRHDDTLAINRAIVAANQAGGGTVARARASAHLPRPCGDTGPPDQRCHF
jgi:hypothetical protein